jgi:hypothetical protein
MKMNTNATNPMPKTMLRMKKKKGIKKNPVNNGSHATLRFVYGRREPRLKVAPDEVVEIP